MPELLRAVVTDFVRIPSSGNLKILGLGAAGAFAGPRLDGGLARRAVAPGSDSSGDRSSGEVSP